MAVKCILQSIYIYIYIMIINLSGDDDDVVWVCGECGDGVCMCVCSLHYTVVMMALYTYLYEYGMRKFKKTNLASNGWGWRGWVRGQHHGDVERACRPGEGVLQWCSKRL